MSRRLLSIIALVGMMSAIGLAAQPPAPPRPNPLAGPQKAVNEARAEVEKAKLAMFPIRKRVEAQFEVKPEFKAAKDAMAKSKADYELQAQKLTASLQKTPDYKAQVEKRDKAQLVLDNASKPTPIGSDAPKISDEEVNAASKDRADAGLAIKKMETDATNSDPTYLSLKQKYNAAKSDWDALAVQIDDAMKLDPSYPDAKRNLDSAEMRLQQALDAYKAAVKAANQPKTPVRR